MKNDLRTLGVGRRGQEGAKIQEKVDSLLSRESIQPRFYKKKKKARWGQECNGGQATGREGPEKRYRIPYSSRQEEKTTPTF